MNVEGQADIAVMGLAVMGQNLILNMNDHGFKVAAYNRTTSKVDDFLNNEARGTEVIGVHSIEELVASLKAPRRIMLMIKAGEAVDDTIEQLLPHLDPGDIIIDGGNSLYTDTIRRVEYLESKGFYFVGCGVSGGEEGARRGPSLMPGGSEAAWEHIETIFKSISAKAEDGAPCCEWIGSGGAGHYVKMVHNGIEYADMELISEAYIMLKQLCHLTDEQMSAVFAKWNTEELDSYLIEITSHILNYKDTDGSYLIDKILDSAGQKGTGKWTVISSANMGQPSTIIAEALYARFMSSLKDERIKASEILEGPQPKSEEDFVDKIKGALYAAKIIAYTQGFMLIKSAAKTYGWDFKYGDIAKIWREGCIIRSKFLNDITESYIDNPGLENLLFAPFFKKAFEDNQASLREIVSHGINDGIPVPAFSSAVNFFDSYRSKTLPANLIQAQRDYFGAHTYERVDKPAGQFFHTNWTGTGGDVSSSTYNA